MHYWMNNKYDYCCISCAFRIFVETDVNIMNTLYQKFETLLQNTPANFKRYIYEEIAWDSRMIGIIGARGVGKTTLILQHIKEKLDSRKALYISADDRNILFQSIACKKLGNIFS